MSFNKAYDTTKINEMAKELITQLQLAREHFERDWEYEWVLATSDGFEVDEDGYGGFDSLPQDAQSEIDIEFEEMYKATIAIQKEIDGYIEVLRNLTLAGDDD